MCPLLFAERRTCAPLSRNTEDDLSHPPPLTPIDLSRSSNPVRATLGSLNKPICIHFLGGYPMFSPAIPHWNRTAPLHLSSRVGSGPQRRLRAEDVKFSLSRAAAVTLGRGGAECSIVTRSGWCGSALLGIVYLGRRQRWRGPPPVAGDSAVRGALPG